MSRKPSVALQAMEGILRSRSATFFAFAKKSRIANLMACHP